MNVKLPAGYGENSSGMLTKSLSCGNMASEMRARGQAGRHMVWAEGDMRMIWWVGKWGRRCLRR